MLRKEAVEAHDLVCKFSGNVSLQNVRKAEDIVKSVYERLKKENDVFGRNGCLLRNEELILRLREDMYFLDALYTYLKGRGEVAIERLRFWSCQPYKSIVDNILSASKP